MKRTDRNLMLCAMVFAVSLVVANMVTAKTINTGIPLFGNPIALPGAAVCYAITYLMTDVIGEVWGRREARMVVYGGFLCQLLALGLILFTQALPAVDPSMQAAYEMLLGQNAVFVVGSMTAYLMSQSWDVAVFHRLRNRVLGADAAAVSKRWIWNNASTMTSQVIDTVVFITISFGIGFGWLFDPAMLPQLGAMMVGQYALKFILAALDTPIFYLLTRGDHAKRQLSDEPAAPGAHHTTV
ncbi:queuosine precursor transporter [Eggerthellaceae bacterium zg-1084]|uniref:Probable queuosine precursor transporter n=1 Tax=Berryella wangjianweii TaxID=2734634 RepID=A0A6M8J707_9ACTN|nr:queuosine precursor transporter [Berryella wangjianweii]NPD30753.1 queuosine precursor transporter [Berryella wangjianweii]QKF07388.1 queuosine precursor transporter [Berryella wangjianweii]